MPKASWFHGKVSDAAANSFFKQASTAACHALDDYVPETVAGAIRQWAHQHGTHENAVLAALLTTTAAVVAGKVVINYQPDTADMWEYVPALYLMTLGPTQRNLEEPMNKYCAEILGKIEQAHETKILCDANTANGLDKHVVSAKGTLVLVKDNILPHLRAVTGNLNRIHLLNQGFAGQRLRIQTNWRKPADQFVQGCFVVHGTAHPKLYANVMRDVPHELDDHLQRWLATIVGLPIGTAPPEATPFDLEGTFMALYNMCKSHKGRDVYHLSRDALNLFFKYDEYCKKERKGAKSSSAEYCFDPAKAYKLAFILHLLVNSLLSFLEKGKIRIPRKVTGDTMRKAIKYTQVSRDIYLIFNGLAPKLGAKPAPKAVADVPPAEQQDEGEKPEDAPTEDGALVKNTTEKRERKKRQLVRSVKEVKKRRRSVSESRPAKKTAHHHHRRQSSIK